MIEIVNCFEEVSCVCDLNLNEGADFVQKRSEPVVGAVLVH